MQAQGYLLSQASLSFRDDSLHEKHHICVPEEKLGLGIMFVLSRIKGGNFFVGALRVFTFDLMIF